MTHRVRGIEMTHITYPTPPTHHRPRRCACRHVLRFWICVLCELTLRVRGIETTYITYPTPYTQQIQYGRASRYVFCVTWLVEFVGLRWHISHILHPTHEKYPIAVLLDTCSVWHDSSNSWDWDDTYHMPYTLHITNTLWPCFLKCVVWRESSSSWNWDDIYHMPYTLHITNTRWPCF